jgi:hypothetical protein
MRREHVLPLAVWLVAASLTVPTWGQEGMSLLPLEPLAIGTDTGEKPQSKVWTHDGQWWAVLTDSHDRRATKLWLLTNDNVWSSVLTLSTTRECAADVCPDGALTHALLLADEHTAELVTLAYDDRARTYEWWLPGGPVQIDLGNKVEAATLAADSLGRMWIASDTDDDIVVHWSDSPYRLWSQPLVLANRVGSDDICAITALPNDTVGVLWSDQRRREFGYRFRHDADPPESWSDPECINDGRDGPIADDHLNVAVAADATLYAAVKTSYSGNNQTLVGMLLREPDGHWHGLYHIDDQGTRPIVMLNEVLSVVTVAFSVRTGGGGILYRQSPMYKPGADGTIEFGPLEILIEASCNDATSTKQNWCDDVVVLASNGSVARGVLMQCVPYEPPAPLVAYWTLDEGAGAILYDCAQDGPAHDAHVEGDPSWVDGVSGDALQLNGRDEYALVAHSLSLNVTGAITLAAWVRPERQASQKIISKVDDGAGYALSLSSKGYAKVKFNDSSSLRVYSKGEYPTDGDRWMHVAATYDGQTIRIYLDGQEDNRQSAVFDIKSNDDMLGLGAKASGDHPLDGAVDEVRIYRRALSASEIRDLAWPLPR